jgi:ferredoxin
MTEKNDKPRKMEDVQAKADLKVCPVQKALVFVDEFLSDLMCGKCFPCSMGSYETRIRLRRITESGSAEEDIAKVKNIAEDMLVSSMCKKGKDTAKYVLECLESNQFTEHLSGVCLSSECSAHIQYVIIPEKCTMCGDCQDVCKDNAIVGEKKKPFSSGYSPFEIAQKRCTKCGECIKVCKFESIECVPTGKTETEPVGA